MQRVMRLNMPDELRAELDALARSQAPPLAHELRAALHALQGFEVAEVSVRYHLRGAVVHLAELQTAVEESVQAPGRNNWLPRTRDEWYAFLALLVAVLTLMHAEFSKSDTHDVDAAARDAVKQLLESAEPTHASDPNTVIVHPGMLPPLTTDPPAGRDEGP
jgi:hypothetical protein